MLDHYDPTAAILELRAAHSRSAEHVRRGERLRAADELADATAGYFDPAGGTGIGRVLTALDRYRKAAT